MKSITSTIIAAVIASAAYGTAALADRGDYYQGASKQQSTDVDQTQTGSIGGNHPTSTLFNNGGGRDNTDVNRGDYYEGANRPN